MAVKPEGLAKLPVEKSLGWKPDGPLSSQELRGQKITLNECATVAGATLWQQQGYLSSARNAAGQQLFSFPDAASAKGAYDQLVADMNNCQATSRGLQAREGVPQDAVVSTTATSKDGTAWSRHWTGTARDVQTNHLYAVHQGDHLTLFQFDELAERPAPPHDTGTDAAVLGALADLGAQN
ncbi:MULTISPECIES: sensor domain-containing protein [Streptomyces]|uniref:sensor domain-containing protein n=1 Tax=Streptomyces TaxID=1883 RepID=UPI000C2B5C19|nr:MULTISPECIES: sensor domain-containing protein [Streptomyces]